MGIFGKRKPTASENRLEASLRKALDDSSAIPSFYRELLVSEIHFVGFLPPEGLASTVGVAKGVGKLDVLTYTVDGQAAIAIFSSGTRVQAALPAGVPVGMKVWQIPARALFQSLAGERFVLNMGSPLSTDLPPELVQALLSGTTFVSETSVKVGGAGRIQFRIPWSIPARVLQALEASFERLGLVAKAYLLEIPPSSAIEPLHLAAIAELRRDARLGFGEFVAEVSTDVTKALDRGQLIDFIELRDVQDLLPSDARPFYTR